MDRLTQNERQISPSYIKDLSTDRKEDFKNQQVMDLMKSGADFGASFANQRWRSPQGEVPVSGFKPENIKGEMKEFGQDLTRERGRYDNVRNIDQKVLQYLAEKREKEEQDNKDRELKIRLQEMKSRTPEGGALTEYQKRLLAQRDKEFNAKIGLAKQKALQPKYQSDYKQLPIESQEQVKKIASKIGDRKTILSDLESQLKKLKESPTEDLKVQAGREMIKTLNSQQGSDAVGVEEAKRLAGFLEYKILNFTEPGSFIGRDLDDFVISAEGTINSLKDSTNRMQNQINDLYGRQHQPKKDTEQEDLYNRLLDDYTNEPEGTPRKSKLKQALEKIDNQRSQVRP